MDAADARRELSRLRGSIDNMDSMLVHLLAERFKVTQEVGRLKAAAALPPADPEREAQQIRRLRALAIETAASEPPVREWAGDTIGRSHGLRSRSSSSDMAPRAVARIDQSKRSLAVREAMVSAPARTVGACSGNERS